MTKDDNAAYRKELERIYRQLILNPRLAKPDSIYNYRFFSDTPEMRHLVDNLFALIPDLRTHPDLSRTPKAVEKAKRGLNNLLSNFIIARLKATISGHKDFVLAIRTALPAFKLTRYNKGYDYFRYRTIIPIIKILESNKYIERYTGFPGEKPAISKLRSTGKLLQLIAAYKISPCMVRKLSWKEVIHLTKPKKAYGKRIVKRLDYKDNGLTKSIRAEVETLNRILESTKISLKLDGGAPNGTANLLGSLENKSRVKLKEYLLQGYLAPIQGVYLHLNDVFIVLDHIYALHSTKRGTVVNLHYIPLDPNSNLYKDRLKYRNNNNYRFLYYTPHTHTLCMCYKTVECELKGNLLHRTFNVVGDFDPGATYWNKGGRFFAPHMNLSEELRRHIFINDIPTVSLDFGGMFVQMAYHLKGVECPYNDPYEGIPIEGIDIPRQIWKTATSICFNIGKEDRAIKAVVKATKDIIKEDRLSMKPIKYDQAKKIVEYIKKRHQKIASDFFTWKGADLMYYESETAARVMKELMIQNPSPIVVLSLHDGFIVQEQYKDLLQATMKKSYQTVLATTFEPIIK